MYDSCWRYSKYWAEQRDDQGGAASGSYNLVVTPASGTPASQNITLRAAGGLTVSKELTSPTGRNPLPGEPITFKIKPQLNDSADALPDGATIKLVDTLPGANDDDFALTTATGCAVDGRTVTCSISGSKTVAEINATEFTIVGKAKKSADSLTNVVNVQVDGSYVDLTLDDNNAEASFDTDTGGDPKAEGAYTSDPTPVGSTQQLTLTYRNNGPTTIPTGGTITTTIPAGFGITTLPTGCTSTPDATEASSERAISCTTSNTIAPTAAQDFTLVLVMPGTESNGSFPVEVTAPTDFADSNTENNTTSLPWEVSPPYSDLKLEKSKTGGPKFTGDTVTSTFKITNTAPDTQPELSYTGDNPLRVVDWLNPLEIADGTVSDVTSGWSCTVATGQIPPSGYPDANTTRVSCHTNESSSLASSGGNTTMSFTTTLGSVTTAGTPVLLMNHACVGKTAETQLNIDESSKLLVADQGSAHNCQASNGDGDGLYLTDVEDSIVTISKQVRKGELGSWVDSTMLANSENTIQWLVTIDTTGATQTIPTLKLTENIPARMQHNAGANLSTETTVATTVKAGSATGACPTSLTWNGGALNCTFTEVAENTKIEVLITMKRPLASGDHINTATLTSPDSTLKAPDGGQLSDSAGINVAPRFDPAVTSKTVTGWTAGNPYKKIGETVEFKISVANHGQDVLAVGDFTLIDEFNADTSKDEVAYKVISATMPNANCSIDEPATDKTVVKCTNTADLNQGNTREATIKARLLKPSNLESFPNAGEELFDGKDQTNTARVVLNDSKCEWREQAQVSTACNDDDSKSNNQKSAVFKVKVPGFDLIVTNNPIHASPVEVGSDLRYRFTLRNNGPSRAEDVVMINHLEIPLDYTLTMSTGGAEKINEQAAQSGFTLKSGASVTCTQAENNGKHYVSCALSGEDRGLEPGEEVNFELQYAMSPPDPANKVVSFHNAALICANELGGHEEEGGCGTDRLDYDSSRSDNATVYANNLASNNVPVFPKTDLAINKETVTESPVALGDVVEYKLSIWNNGTATAERIRITDTLPAGFTWLSTQPPVVQVPTGSDVSVSGGELASNALGVLGAAPAIVVDDSTQNVCYLTAASPDPVTATGQQVVMCDLEGWFPAGEQNVLELSLFATPSIGIYTGPYLTDVTNQVAIAPGKTDGFEEGEDDDGNPIVKNRDASLDDDPYNNNGDSPVQVAKSSIAGYVYHDENNDGIFDSTETPIWGVTITLSGKDKHGNNVELTTTTGSDGSYLFDNLVPGTYTVTETHPTGWVDGKDTVGKFGSEDGSGTAGDDVISQIELPIKTDGVEYNFGELKDLTDPSGDQVASISGYVYHDKNNDGNRDADEEPIEGVVITLKGENGDERTATTDANGYYEFKNLEPGVKYTVTETQPEGWADGKDTVGTEHTSESSTNDEFVVTTVSGKDGEDWNFGERKVNPTPVPVDNPLALLALILGMGWMARRFHMRKHA